ncbi:PIG-L family deacetylase [Salegentibacter sp. F188]|uniref:PIG-L family deacetylase n=1 Tax=Autumnicola patrickiae TaxID=3075591 RepID=A0ABU3E3X1_9FLAO|nr:PIG-L family deacetylase [Salegentibacter sp. F188]MDT0690661.1 PIG-L family deacetylase [Salegentibacter sp. F188]
MRKFLFAFIFLSLFSDIQAQAPEKLSASEIFHEIEKLNFLGSVLYLAAHPDDENTRLISYFSNEQNARTAYLSLTRGDGGQNLIGPQIREELGVIRTQELLAARRIDGGQQFFTRANDFGYSKTADETLEIWNKKEVLSDVVWVIRKFKPDVIINRFDHRTRGTTHGHHTSSAILSVEAFELANNKDAFQNQLQYTETHQSERLFFNTSPWFYDNEEAFEEASKINFLKFDTGVYFPLKGLSNPEIAALSRSQHRSQGFGSTGSRGTQEEYLELIKGEIPEGKEDIFEGINTSWSRLEGGAEIGQILNKVQEDFDFTNPAASLPQLIAAYQLINELKNEHWKEIKSEQIKNIIAASGGLYLEAVAGSSAATPSQEVPVKLEAINRSDFAITLQKVELSPNNSSIEPAVTLKNNNGWSEELALKIPESTKATSPYWLNEEGTTGMYNVENRELIGLPETPNSTKAVFYLDFNGVQIPFSKEVVYKYNDNVFGETYRSFEIIQPVSVEFEESVIIFDNAQKRQISAKIVSGKENLQGTLTLDSGENWKIEPKSRNFNIAQKGGSVTLNFSITPPANESETYIIPKAKVEDKIYSEKTVHIDYEHIPYQTLVLPSKLKVAKLNIEKKGEQIAYIEGAGDVVPESLEQIGYKVTRISPAGISEASLKRFDAVVLGIRAYNIVEELKYKQNVLLNYVKNGGNLIVQYNTNRGLKTDNIAPYHLELSRDRVTDENAEVRFLAEDHPLLNYPNKINKEDFENWVQERGLYFPSAWAPEFTPVLSMNDQGETPKDGSLLVAKYGEGYYIYTGISFFREFPAGVPGAYKLFANMISIGK